MTWSQYAVARAYRQGEDRIKRGEELTKKESDNQDALLYATLRYMETEES